MANTPLRAFVKPGEPLGFVAALQDRGLWPPKLRDGTIDHGDRGKTVTTPFLVIPTTIAPADSGLRPQPNSKTFHSTGIWIEDLNGAVADKPIVGGQYRIKCRIRNLGAFPAYGGMADFFINTPAAFTTAAGTAAALPAMGHTGFTLIQGQETVITCPNTWKPATPGDLASSIVVHAYDPFADNLTGRFDARNDRHVGRHDFTPDLYVRDWTDSAAVHDDGIEPSARNVFYRTSDVWNRRTAAPGALVGDQPQNEDPQQGSGAAGDNFVNARISRNDASTDQTLRAHFLFAEFGTGSPFIDCSAAPDPIVTLLAGETSKIVTLPWHLHPSSSNHLCLAVQVYSAEDPYLPPGLLGYTPGWPTTDMMVINDNNKAQRNISVWDGLPDTEGAVFGIVFNAATVTRDVTLLLDASKGALQKVRNARVGVPLSGLVQEFRPRGTLVLKGMLPGERRWVTFSHDGIAFAGSEDMLSVSFGEWVDGTVLNGFGFDLCASTPARLVQSVISFQGAIFHRMSEGMRVEGAREGSALCARLQKTQADPPAYLKALPALTRILGQSVKTMSVNYGGVKDVFGLEASFRKLESASATEASAALALHHKVLHQVDAVQTMAVKSRGDAADIPFTMRLQKEIYNAGALASRGFDELRKSTGEFISTFAARQTIAADYVTLAKASTQSFEATVSTIATGPVKAWYGELTQSLARGAEEVQKAHLGFLNAVLLSLSVR